MNVGHRMLRGLLLPFENVKPHAPGSAVCDGCSWAAGATRLLTLGAVLNGESESFGAIVRGARATMGVAFGCRKRSLETENTPGTTQFPPNPLPPWA